MTETTGSVLRPSELDRLVQLDASGKLSVDELRAAAQKLGIPERQVRPWLTSYRTRHASGARRVAPEPATRKMGYREAVELARIPEVEMTTGDDVLSRIPDSDVPTFRADAYRGLTPEEFARLDAIYVDGIDATCRWLAARTGRPCVHPDPGEVTDPATRYATTAYLWDQQRPHALPGLPEAGNTGDRREILGLYRFLGELVCGSPGRGHTIARLRGAQAGFLLHGMRLDLPPDLNYSVGPGFTTQRVDSATVELIRANTSNPVDAAALATALCTGATMVELGSVPCTAITPEDALVFTGPIGYGQAADVYVWVVPPPARRLLHDARMYQETRAGNTSRLFAGAIGGAGRRLRGTAARCGVTVPDLHHWHHSWIRRTGLLRGADQPEHVLNTDLLFALRFHSNPGPARGR